MSVSVSGRLPEGDGNGLTAILTDLIRDPKKLHVCICIVDGKKVTTDADTGETVPTARIRRIEVVQDTEDMIIARAVMLRALDRRNGAETLPYNLEAEIRAAFGVVKPDEGGQVQQVHHILDADGPLYSCSHQQMAEQPCAECKLPESETGEPG